MPLDVSAIGPAAAAVAIVWIFVRYLIPAINKLTVSSDSLVEKVQRGIDVDREMLKFMKNLNGELKAAAQKKLEIK